MNKTLESLYAELQRLQGVENPSQDAIARVTYKINQEKAELARSKRPPKEFGANMHPLKEFIRRYLKEYNTKNKPSS